MAQPDLLADAGVKKERAKSSHPEASLQVSVKKWCRECIAIAHKFKAFERSKNSFTPGAKVGRHFWEANKGVEKGTLDTCVIIEGGAHHWIELKAPGIKIDPVDDEAQLQEIRDLTDLGVRAAWTNSVSGYAQILKEWGVPLYGLAMTRALDLDLLLKGRKMKRAGVPKKKRSDKPRTEKPTGSQLRVAHRAWSLQK